MFFQRLLSAEIKFTYIADLTSPEEEVPLILFLENLKYEKTLAII